MNAFIKTPRIYYIYIYASVNRVLKLIFIIKKGCSIPPLLMATVQISTHLTSRSREIIQMMRSKLRCPFLTGFGGHRGLVQYKSSAELHLELKSREISFAHSLFLSCQIFLKFVTEHGSITAVNTAVGLRQIPKRFDNCTGCYGWPRFYEITVTK